MNARQIVLGVVLLFVVGLGGLTLDVILSEGLDVLTVLSLLVLALFGFGVVGALRHPPDE
jgi:hypothetical protein